MSTATKMTVSDILKGCTAGQIQSVGCMQVIPLLSDISDDRFVSPSEATVSTTGYGTLVFKNMTDKTMIIPAQAAYVVKEAAQDHALPHSGLIKGKARKAFDTACCIQQTQGGYIREGQHSIIILPFLLREEAHSSRSTKSYNKLWPAITKLNAESGVGGAAGGHLNLFLDHFEKQLQQFVAEFENLPKQVGAIILVGGEVVGIERAPSPEYWRTIWRPLIRECYGSLALLWAQKGREGSEAPGTRIALKKGCKTIADLKKALSDASQKERDGVKKLVEEVSAVELEAKSDEADGGLSVDALSSDRFVGQVVRESSAVLYGSVIAKRAWANASEWAKKATPFRM